MVYEPSWARSFIVDYGRLNVVAADSQQNVYVAGELRGDVDFGEGEQDLFNSASFISSYAPDGSLRFVELFDSSGWPSERNADVDDDGNSFLVIPFRESLEIVDQTIVGPADAPSWAIVSLDPAGVHRWNLVASATDLLQLQAHAGDDGNLHVLANIRSGRPLTIGDTTLSAEGTSYDIAWLTIDASGSLTSARTYGGVGAERATGIVVDESGNAYIAGSFGNDAELGGETLTKVGDADGFVACYDSDGNHRWSRVFMSENTAALPMVSRSKDADLLLAGRATAQTDLGFGPLDHDGSGYVARVGGNGKTEWAFGARNEPTAIAQAPDGLVLLGRSIEVASPKYDELYLDVVSVEGEHLQTIRGQSAGAARISDIVVTQDYLYFVGYSEEGPARLFDFGDFIGKGFDRSGFIAQYRRTQP